MFNELVVYPGSSDSKLDGDNAIRTEACCGLSRSTSLQAQSFGPKIDLWRYYLKLQTRTLGIRIQALSTS